MKLNIDCVRDIMLAIEENLGIEEIWYPSDLQEALPSYSMDDLQYSCQKLYEGGFINAIPHFLDKGHYIFEIGTIHSLTYKGHEFLETIRPESVYTKLKNGGKSACTKSLELLYELGKSILLTTLQTGIMSTL